MGNEVNEVHVSTALSMSRGPFMIDLECTDIPHIIIIIIIIDLLH